MKKILYSGFSLLELLVASALGTLIIAGLMTIYIGIKTNNNRQQVLIDLQDSERFAQTILSQRIRVAGLAGCANTITGYSSDNLPSVLQNQVMPGTDAVVVDGMAYYIGDTGRVNQQGQPILALFQKPLNGDREELVAGVEQMKILYNNYPAVQVVAIDLVFNSINAAVNKPQTYYFQGQTITPADLLLHRPWHIDVTLRERAP